MAPLFHACRNLGVTLVVALGFLLVDCQKAQAGCGDHGYIVQREKGDVVVVTPSNPKCPCKGPKCQKQEFPSNPLAPAAPAPVPVDEAWHTFHVTDPPSQSIPVVYPSPLISHPTGHPDDILQPPRR